MIIGTAKRNKEGAKPLPTRHYSSRQEKDVAKAVNGKVQKNSGATDFAKGDVITSGKNSFLLECKTKTSASESINIKKEWFEKNGKGCNAVIGISGGLDSTLALLVAVEAMRRLGRPRSDVYGITMPCFGTSDRTYQNAWELMRKLGISAKEINIKNAVAQHFQIHHRNDYRKQNYNFRDFA